MKQWFFSIIVISLLFGACDIINPDEINPAILVIDEIIVDANPATEGSSTHGFSDTWVFVNNQSAGVFPLPSEIPVLDLGTSGISVFAGIKNNNQSGNRGAYPFVTSDTMTVNFVEGETVHVTATIEYKSDLVFAMISDFDQANNFVVVESTGQLLATSEPGEVFEGTRSLKFTADELNPEFEIRSIETYELPSGDNDIYIEMDFYNESALTVGMTANIENNPPITVGALNIGPKSEWRKIYIPLSALVNEVGADSYNVAFSGFLIDSLSSADYYWDNIKLIYEE